MNSAFVDYLGEYNRFEKLTELRLQNPENSETENDKNFLEISFSSETPVERWFGKEILSHEPTSVDLSRTKGMAFLWNHDPDKVLGVVENLEIRNDRRGYATIRWSKKESVKEYRDDVSNNILSNISFSYRIDELIEYGENAYLATKWTPIEISLVSVPADVSVGVGRNQEKIEKNNQKPQKDIIIRQENCEKKMATPENDDFVSSSVASIEDIRKAELERTREIRTLCKNWDLADQSDDWIEKGSSVEQVRIELLEIIGKQRSLNKDQKAAIPALGWEKQEERNYSLCRAILAAKENNWKKAGLEKAASDALAERMGFEPKGQFFVPIEDLLIDTRTLPAMAGQRAYTVGAPTTAGNLVETVLDTSRFVDFLYNKCVMLALGATQLTGLVGNLNVPNATSRGSWYWVAENAAPSETTQTFGLIQFRPKTLGVLSTITRLMLLQTSPSVETYVRMNLAQLMAEGLDTAIIAGTGLSDQPTGILNTAGVNSIALGVNGGAISFDDLIDMETLVGNSNADFMGMSYVLNSKTVGALKKLKSSTGEYLWKGTDLPMSVPTPGSINSYLVARTNVMPSNLTKGTGTNLSAGIFGHIPSVYVGMWGALDMDVNPYGTGWSAGTTQIKALQTVDVQLAYNKAFSVVTDIIA